VVDTIESARGKNSALRSDEELIARVAGGDRVAFDQLVRRYYRKIYATCFRLLNNREEAEDAVQDVFLKIYRNASSFKQEKRFSTWVYRVAVNHCLNRLRWKKKRRWLSLDGFVRKNNEVENDARLGDFVEEKDVLQPDEQLLRQERAWAVRKAIAALPEQQRVAVILHRYEGLSYKEIAEVMGTSVSSVEARLHRAKVALAKKLVELLELTEKDGARVGLEDGSQRERMVERNERDVRGEP